MVTAKTIQDSNDILADVIRQLKEQGNPLYAALITPRTLLNELMWYSKLAKDENLEYIIDENKELRFAPTNQKHS